MDEGSRHDQISLHELDWHVLIVGWLLSLTLGYLLCDIFVDKLVEKVHQEEDKNVDVVDHDWLDEYWFVEVHIFYEDSIDLQTKSRARWIWFKGMLSTAWYDLFSQRIPTAVTIFQNSYEGLFKSIRVEIKADIFIFLQLFNNPSEFLLKLSQTHLFVGRFDNEIELILEMFKFSWFQFVGLEQLSVRIDIWVSPIFCLFFWNNVQVIAFSVLLLYYLWCVFDNYWAFLNYTNPVW